MKYFTKVSGLLGSIAPTAMKGLSNPGTKTIGAGLTKGIKQVAQQTVDSGLKLPSLPKI